MQKNNFSHWNFQKKCPALEVTKIINQDIARAGQLRAYFLDDDL